MNAFTLPWTDGIFIHGKLYSKKKLCLDWFQMSNDGFYDLYGFNFNPHEYPGLYDWGRKTLYGERGSRMAEYIDRNLCEIVAEYDQYYKLVVSLEKIRKMPAADVVEVRHGRWIGMEYDGYADGFPVYDLWECSECGEEVRGEDVPSTHPWCHSCGARMDKEDEQ